MTEVLRVERATLRRETTAILSEIDWTVNEGERWVILGPNGAGKTSLLTLAAARNHPSEGGVWVLGERLGETTVQELRIRVGLASDALADEHPPGRGRPRRRAHGCPRHHGPLERGCTTWSTSSELAT